MAVAGKWTARQQEMIDACTGPEARKALRLPPEPRNSTEALEMAVERLAALSPTEFEGVRKNEAKKLGVRASQLDRFVGERRGKTAAISGRPLNLNEPEPWPDPVDGAALLDEIAKLIRRFVVASDSIYIAAALWVLFTYVIDAFDLNPILAIQSPGKRSGKTKLMRLLLALVLRALPGANVTGATIFRVIEASRPTLLLDEGDTFIAPNGDNGNEEIRGILNSAHDRAMAWVPRLVPIPGGDYEPRTFSTFAPIAIALIHNLPDTLEDRSIVIPLKRKLKAEMVERYRRHHEPELMELARKCARWAADNIETLKAASDPGGLDALDDRAFDNWLPLLAIAGSVSPEWLKRAAAAIELSKCRAETTESFGEMLLADLRQIFGGVEGATYENLSSATICEHLGRMEDRPWREYGRSRKPISQKQLAELLKPFRVYPGTVRIGIGKKDTVKGYKLEDLQDVLDRYLQREAENPQGEIEI
jgi:putative DNA primase/helicase